MVMLYKVWSWQGEKKNPACFLGVSESLAENDPRMGYWAWGYASLPDEGSSLPDEGSSSLPDQDSLLPDKKFFTS